jgi:hypothetical protein
MIQPQPTPHAVKLLGLHLSIFGEAHGLVLADWIVNVALLVQSVERVPIMTLPGGTIRAAADPLAPQP